MLPYRFRIASWPGLWNLLLGAKKLILVSFLRPQVDGHRAYEKAGVCQCYVTMSISEDTYLPCATVDSACAFTVFQAGFPERSEDWFYTMFLYKSTIELKKGSVMYSLRNVKSQAGRSDWQSRQMPSNIQ